MRIGKYEIDPILFRKGFSKGCGPSACESLCCTEGVMIDLKEKELILSHKETIVKHMDETQTTDETRWFDSEAVNDIDFQSGKSLATQVHHNKCVFLNKSGMCSLQMAGVKEEMGRWAIKPFYCVAFPITVEAGLVTFDDMFQGRTKCCSESNDTESILAQSCKDELEFVLGHDGYSELLGAHEHSAPAHSQQ